MGLLVPARQPPVQVAQPAVEGRAGQALEAAVDLVIRAIAIGVSL